MRVGLISSRYEPESSPGAKRASDLARSLRSAGHRLTVLTQLPNYPDPSLFDFETPRDSRPVIEEDGAGNAVWRFPPRIVSKGDLVHRLLAEARFSRAVSLQRTGLRQFDGVIASTPFVSNLRAARSYRVPVWLDVRDLTWEYARSMGRKSVLKTVGAYWLRSIALASFRAASGISTTTEGQRRYLIERGIAARKVRVVPNGVPRKLIEELVRMGRAAPDAGAATAKVVYAGLLGFPQGIEFVVDGIGDMAGEGVELHLFGDGVDRERLAERCRERELRNVFFHGYVSHALYLEAIATADILLASLRPQAQTAMPSKLLEYMAAGKPILFVGAGEGARAVEEVRSGLCVPYGDSGRFRDRLRVLAADSTLRAELGANGRDWVARHRVREDINGSWVAAIEDAFRSTARVSRSRADGDGRPWVQRQLRRTGLAAARGAATCGLVRLLEGTAAGGEGCLRVLTYHRVVEDPEAPDACPGLVSATPRQFATQMEFVAKRYRVVSVEDVLDAVRERRSLPRRALLLTFDDAYADFAEHAWPVLRRLGLPVTMFVPTAFPDHPERVFWWDRLYQAISATRRAAVETPVGSMPLGTREDRARSFRWLRERLKELPHEEAMDLVESIVEELGPGGPPPRVLGWDALRTLRREGTALGAHTRTHPAIHRIPLDEVEDEVAGSLEDLERETGEVLPIFAYPAGRFDAAVVRVVARAGIELAFTTRGGWNDLRHGDPLELRRLHVGQRTDLAALRVQLVGLRPPRWLRK